MSEKTNLTVIIDKEVKHLAKVKAVTKRITLKEYVEELIRKDIGVVKNEKMDR